MPLNLLTCVLKLKKVNLHNVLSQNDELKNKDGLNPAEIEKFIIENSYI